ncbi:MAG TPA: hypothetical protein VFR13_04515 [Jiangellaceae bacterium]|nr:hypothetical protein [Jiangellaceae bacterium]
MFCERTSVGLDVHARSVVFCEHLRERWADWEPTQVAGMVKIGIETDRGPWVAALVAAGYEVFARNPMSVARYRERHSSTPRSASSARW